MFTGFRRVFAVLAVVPLCGAAPSGTYSSVPDDVYLEGYLAYQKGEDLLKKGNEYDALMKLREAKDRFDYVWRTWPQWQPQMVEYRRKAVHELVATTEVAVKRAAVDAGPMAMPPVRPAPHIPETTGDPMQDAANRYRALEEENRRQKQYLAEKERQLERALRDKRSADDERRRLQVRVTELEGHTKLSVEASRKLGDAQRAASAAQARERAANQKVAELEVALEAKIREAAAAAAVAAAAGAADRDKIAAESQQLREQLSAAQKTATEAQVSRTAGVRQVDALDQELRIARAAAAQAQGLLEAAQKEVQAMQEATGEADARSESLARERDELQRRITALEKDRERWKVMQGVGGPSDAVIEDLMGDLDRTKRELSETKGEILKLRDDLAKARQENHILKGQNAELVAKLQQKDELLKLKGAEVQKLRKELEAVKAEVKRLTEENEAYKIHVAELQVELKNTAARLTEAMQADAEKADSIDPELMSENKLMRGQIIRMMRTQSLRKQQKELMIEELTKYGNNSTKMLEMLELYTIETSVTEEVAQKILDGSVEDLGDGRAEAVIARPGGGFPELPPFDPKNGVPGGERPDAASPPVPPHPAEQLTGLLAKAGELCKAGHFAEAENGYQDYLRGDPNNPTALANLGLVKMNLGKYREADLVLRKALATRPGDSFSQFVLGVNAYQEGNLEEAKTALGGSLRSDAGNAQAYHYLGVIAIEEGRRDEAVEQFLNAVKTNPKYATAHYNLSVLYATAPEPNLEHARWHYARALEYGAERDPAMEKLVQ